MNSKIDKDRRFKAAYPISHHGLQSVFQLLSKSVALQYIDDSNVKQETVAAHITSRDAPSPVCKTTQPPTSVNKIQNLSYIDE